MDLKKNAHVHFMGICGTAMGSLAGLMKEMGFHVTGSDQNVYPPMSTQLEALGIPIQPGYKKENLNPKPDLVIVGNVISKHFEEAEALLASEIPYMSLPQAMGEFLIQQRESLVVAGTHGKSTTTSLLAWILESCSLKPGFLVGGIPINFGRSFAVPKANHFVIEGDEYDTAFFDKVPKFIHYRPKHVIFTSLEFDHADIYKDIEQIRAAFRKLIALIPKDGTLVYYADDPEVAKLAAEAKCARVVSYGLEQGDYRAIERESLFGRNQFAVQKEGQGKVADLAVKFFGQHNTANVLAAFCLADQLELPKSQVMGAIASFKGVKRRQEILGAPGGVTVIEDFAHHPTAVRLTIDSVREISPEGRVIAIFEPRSATARRKIFEKDFAEALGHADFAAIAKPFDQSKIPGSERMNAQHLVDALNVNTPEKGFLGETTEDLVQWCQSHARSGDTVLIMSNGGFDGIYEKIMKVLEN